MVSVFIEHPTEWEAMLSGLSWLGPSQGDTHALWMEQRCTLR